jgi:hypothetical protein
MPRGSVKVDARRELARRLGLKPDELLTRPELAKRLKTTVKALSVNLKTHPPFYSKGARYSAFYPLEWVRAHTRGERIGQPGDYIEGRQDWPPALPTAPSDTEELVRFLVKDEDHANGVLTGNWSVGVSQKPL